jgi:hypothetical protein
MNYSVGLVHRGNTVHAWVFDLPGCIAGAPDVDHIDAPLRLAIAEHEGWLRAHGEEIAASDGYDVFETVMAAHPAEEIVFQGDCAPVADAELEVMLRRMAYARADLLEPFARLPDAVLDWAPPSSAFDAFDAWAPEVRTIRDLLTHALQFDIYYREGLHDGPAKGISERTGDPVAEREITIGIMRSLSMLDRTRVFQPLRPGQTTPDAWTLRKAIRRIISHERVHAAEVVQRWSWTLLGTPDKRR